MRSVFAGFTTRGRAFVAAGVAAGAFGLALGQRTLLSIGGMLIVLPLLSLLAAGRTRYRLRCVRQITPARVPAGQPTLMSVQLDNVSRLPTGLLLAEDTIPYSLGARPRFILDRIEPGGTRTISYPLQSDTRGKFRIGPLQLHVADTFGLVKLGSQAAPAGTLVVTPAITALPRTALAGSWLGEGGTRASTAAAAGEDDVVPRAYREGDELRRVHWRSTARHGELMVRREEQRWRNRAVLLLDTRSTGHAGRGPASSFEYAVSAAASIGVHLAREGIDGEFVTDTGVATAPGSFEDILLETLAVITPSQCTDLSIGLAQIPRASNGLLVAIMGRLSPLQARQLAAARHSGGPAMALVLAVDTWLEGRPGSGPAPPAPGPAPGSALRSAALRSAALRSAARPPEQQVGPDTAASILAAAGWQVVTVSAGTSVGAAWEALTHAQEIRLAPGAPDSGRATAAAAAPAGAAP